MIVIAAFGLKFVVVATVARLLWPRFVENFVGAFLAAWVVVTGLTFAVLFALSGVGMLSRPVLWIVICAGAAISVPILLSKRVSLPSFREGRALAALFGLLWLGFAARALYFPDHTADAQAYGLVRIAIWMNHGSLFIHMPTRQVNIFANEWNGELLGLYYALATGDLQGAIFANVEVLFVTFLACARLARLLGASWPWALTISGLIALTPAILGLAATVKGDLLAVGATLLALGWLLDLRARRSWWPVAMLLSSLALAMGAKIVALFAGIALAGLALVAAPRALVSVWTLLVASALGTVFLFRFLVNAVVYGNPLHRVAEETLEPGLATFLSNLLLIARRSFEYGARGPDGGVFFSWHLAGGLGVAGLALLLAFGAVILKRRRAPPLLVAALTLSLLVAFFLIPSRPHGLRYFLPTIVPLAVILLALAEPKRARAWIAAALILAAANLTYLFWPGEINGGGSFARAVREQLGRTTIERGFLPWEGRRALSRFDELRLDGAEPVTMVLMQGAYREISQFMGSRAQNNIVLAQYNDQLLAILRTKRADFAVVNKRFNDPLPRRQYDSVVRSGYIWIEDNNVYAIAARADRVEAATMGAVWRSGVYDVEQGKTAKFRWLQGRAEMDVALPNGAACLVLTLFGPGRPGQPQFVDVEGASAKPSTFDLAGTNVDSPKRFLILVSNAGPSARLRFVAAMPEIQLPNDRRRIAFGVVNPALIAPAETCR